MRFACLLLLIACSGKDDTDSADAEEEDPCAAGTPSVALGRTTNGTFAALTDGDTIAVIDSGGTYGYSVELQTQGLALDGGLNVLLRVEYAGTSGGDDALGSLALSCRDDGGWGQMFAALPGDKQDATSVAALSGATATFAVTATDAGGTSGSDQVELEIE